MKTEYMVETSENLITTREFEEDLVRKVNIPVSYTHLTLPTILRV